MDEFNVSHLAETLYDNETRVDMMWPFPCWNAGHEMAEALSMWDREDLPAPLKELLSIWQDEEVDELLSGEGPDFMYAMEELNACAVRKGVSGLLGVVSTPVLHYDSSGKSASFSWGHTYHGLIFGTTLEEFAKEAERWAEKMDEKDKKAAAA